MGNGKSGVRKSTSSSVLDLNNLNWLDAQSKIAELQKAMGQTGMEAGDPDPPGVSMMDKGKKKLYVHTSKAFNINAYLLSDGQTIHSDDSGWDSLGYNERMVKNDIAKIDSGMKPMSQAVQTYRYIDADGLSKMLGLNMTRLEVHKMIRLLDSGDTTAAKNFSTALQNASYTHKGYTSLTYDTSHPGFADRDVRLDIKLNKGTPAIVTNNHVEHEILGGRGLKYNFTKKFKVLTTNTGKKQLVVELSI